MVCTTLYEDRRKPFWATQPEGCGQEDTNCAGNACGIPGLDTTSTDEGSSIDTTDYVRGLILNMLMTDGKEPDTACGYSPLGQGGHWTESYIGGDTVGTLLRTTETYGRTQELVALLQAYTQATLERLISRGVADSVDVVASYVSGGTFNLDIIVSGSAGSVSRVGLTTQRANNTFIWS